MLSGGLSETNKSTQPSERLLYVVRVYSILAFLSLITFGTLHIVADRNFTVGYLEVAGGLVVLLNLTILSLTRKIVVAKNILLFIILSFLVLMLTSGGTQDTGIFWFFVFPITAFFLSGKRQGIWWMAAFFLSMLSVWAFAANHVFEIPYDSITIRQALISVLVVTFGIYAYQQSRERLVGQGVESRKALRNEKVQAEVILQHIDEGIVTTDPAGSVLFMNQAAEKLLGWDASDLFGKKFVDIVPMLDQEGVPISPESRPLRQSLLTGMPSTTIANYRRKDGSAIPVSVASMPVTIDDKVVGSIDTFRDISEERSVVRTKSEFVTLASHQLRTPISAISWLSELLLNGDAGKLSNEQREHIDSIYQSNRRMAELVNQMLIVSSLDLNTMPIVPQKFDISKVAINIVKEQQAAHKAKKMQVTEHYDTALPGVLFDIDVIKLVLRNLLSNAIKYTPKGGQVILRITSSHEEKIRSSSLGSVVISVSDTGFGIPEASTSKIFTKFYRAENIRHKDTDGTGLGLYVVKSLLDYVGGSISFASREGRGTTFTVLLPLEGMQKRAGSKNIDTPGEIGSSTALTSENKSE